MVGQPIHRFRALQAWIIKCRTASRMMLPYSAEGDHTHGLYTDGKRNVWYVSNQACEESLSLRVLRGVLDAGGLHAPLPFLQRCHAAR